MWFDLQTNVVNKALCTGCRTCVMACPTRALTMIEGRPAHDKDRCKMWFMLHTLSKDLGSLKSKSKDLGTIEDLDMVLGTYKDIPTARLQIKNQKGPHKMVELFQHYLLMH